MKIVHRSARTTRRLASGVITVLVAVLSLPTAAAHAELATGTISGTLTSATGAPLADVRVGVQPAAGSTSVAVGLTDSEGRYTLPGLTPGSYKVKFWVHRNSTSEWTQWAYQATRPNRATTFRVTAGSEVVVDETRFATGSLALRLNDAAGQPVDAFCGDVIGDNFVDTGCTETGTLTLTDLPEGEYSVGLWDTADPSVGGWEFATVVANELSEYTVTAF